MSLKQKCCSAQMQVYNSVNIYFGSQFYWLPWNYVKISPKDMDLCICIPLRSFTARKVSIHRSV